MDALDSILSAYGSVAEYNRVQDEDNDYGSDDYKFDWDIVSECNDDNGHPTCYSTKYNGQFYWVSHLENGWCIEKLCADGEYRPINSSCEGFQFANYAMKFFEDNVEELLGENENLKKMHEYGYHYDKMIPISSEEEALAFYDNGETVYLLYNDDTEGMAESREEIKKFVGIYGIEKNLDIKQSNDEVILPTEEKTR